MHRHRYSGPERDTVLLPLTVVTVITFVVATLCRAWRARRAPEAWPRTGVALLATSFAPSVPETGVLGVAFAFGACDVFLRPRGAP